MAISIHDGLRFMKTGEETLINYDSNGWIWNPGQWWTRFYYVSQLEKRGLRKGQYGRYMLFRKQEIDYLGAESRLNAQSAIDPSDYDSAEITGETMRYAEISNGRAACDNFRRQYIVAQMNDPARYVYHSKKRRLLILNARNNMVMAGLYATTNPSEKCSICGKRSMISQWINGDSKNYCKEHLPERISRNGR